MQTFSSKTGKTQTNKQTNFSLSLQSLVMGKIKLKVFLVGMMMILKIQLSHISPHWLFISLRFMLECVLYSRGYCISLSSPQFKSAKIWKPPTSAKWRKIFWSLHNIKLPLPGICVLLGSNLLACPSDQKVWITGPKIHCMWACGACPGLSFPRAEQAKGGFLFPRARKRSH